MKEEELSLFLEMKRRENEQQQQQQHTSSSSSSLLLHSSSHHDFDSSLGLNPAFNMPSSTRKICGDDFLNSEGDKNDYEWLLTPPGTPLFPSLEIESHTTVMSQLGAPKARPTVLKSRLANPQPEPPARVTSVPKQLASSPRSSSLGTGLRRPSSSGGPGSRPATPTGRSTLTSASKPSRSATPTSRATLSSSKPTVSGTKPVASITKSTSFPNSTVPTRSSTPSRSSIRSSTPTRRPSITSSKPAPRASTPTRRPSTPSSAPSTTAPNRSSPTLPLNKSLPAAPKSSPSAPPTKSSPVTKPGPTTAKNPVASRGASPTPKPRPWKPSEMPGYSLDTPPNLRTTLPDRPLSATRGRPGVPFARSSSIEPALTGRPRRQSCSPSRGRPPNGIIHTSGSSVPAFNRGHNKINDNESPVVIGTKMVERVINMRKLAPPKHDDKSSPLSGKSSSPDTTGFGRTLSKKSLDMAIRHMDIRRSIPGNLRPLMTNIPASSMYSVRSGPPRSRTVSVSDSPFATSSNASSEMSVNNNGVYMNGMELEDEIVSERTGRSPLQGR